jgi:DNA polymerase-3 subunit alpha
VWTTYSLLDGISKPKDIAKRCKELGMTSCAITDHGNISGAVSFFKEMKKAKIKPILGIEAYCCEEDPKLKQQRKLQHIVLLAKNKEGWKDLIKIVSTSNKPENFYYKPRLNLVEIAKINRGNIIAICGHLGSLFTSRIFNDDDTLKDAYELNCLSLINDLWDTFGKENFFLEVQLIDQDKNPKAKQIAEIMRGIGRKYNIPLVATPDAHYCRREDAEDQRVVLCSSLQTTFQELQKKQLNGEDIALKQFFISDSYHIPSNEEMQLIHTKEELDNTVKISELCEEYDITNQPQLPKYITPDGSSSIEYLRKLCREGWKKLKSKIESTGIPIKEYVDRFNEEYQILKEVGLEDYFLIVYDIINYVRRNNKLTGVGRGSAGGSLILYLLGITKADPLQYNLLFSRFYNKGRNTKDNISLPDIDMDFESDFRDNIISYIKEKFGKDKVAQISTFSRMQGRSTIKDVLRVHGGISFEEMNLISQYIPDEAEIIDQLQEMREETGDASIVQWALENHKEELKQWCFIREDGELDGPLCKKFSQSIRLEGTRRNKSRHASGIAISHIPLNELCPMAYDKGTESLICDMEFKDLEALGVIKLDILGISLLDKLHEVCRLVNNYE